MPRRIEAVLKAKGGPNVLYTQCTVYTFHTQTKISLFYHACFFCVHQRGRGKKKLGLLKPTSRFLHFHRPCKHFHKKGAHLQEGGK